MNNFKLTDLEHACLLIIRAGGNDKLNQYYKETLDTLLKLDLIQIKPNVENQLMLTITGEDALNKGIMIKYPLHKGNVGSYNDVIKSMNSSATNALVCAMIKENAFKKLPRSTSRVLGQHLLDIQLWKLWGSILISKWKNQCDKSMEYFHRINEKYKNKT